MPIWFSMCAFCPIRISFRGCANFRGKIAKVARYIRSFPQTGEFLRRIESLLTYLIPALYPRGQKLSDHRLRLHGRAPSFGDDGGGGAPRAGRARLYR